MAGAVRSEGTTILGTYTPQQFQEYWYSSKAELSRYSLEQARYGEVHKGDAVFIFVTETMNPNKQVKADRPGPGDIPVLKLNAVRKFFTGIYPYSVMTSSFTPVEANKYPLPLKVTATTQEWCGHVYLQMNLNGDQYKVQSYSYFEKEGDQQFQLEKAIPEDAIWSRIRIAPTTLPQGEFLLIPAAMYVRFAHRPMEALKAMGKLEAVHEKSPKGLSMVRYTINIEEKQRMIQICFEREFPYRIQKWTDTHRGLHRQAPKTITTRAERTHTLNIDYWKHHNNRDRGLLKRLGLGPRELAAR
jgi:hypothetical protein